MSHTNLNGDSVGHDEAGQRNTALALGHSSSQVSGSPPASVSEINSNSSASLSPLYSIETLPNKGRCLIASQDISPGALLIREKPLLMAPRDLAPAALETMIQLTLKTLPKHQQRQYLSLQNNFAGNYPFGGIIPTNAYPCGQESGKCAVYPTICLFNHSCRPNCQHAWNDEEGVETVYVIRPVRKGEELCVSYEVSGPSMDRKAMLEEAFAFKCACEACSLEAEEQAASDARHLAIQRLDERISRLHSRPPLGVLWDCRLLLQILRAEYKGYPGTFAARVYWDAFQVTIAHGDLARARIFVERSYKEAVICEGDNTPEVKSVKVLVKDPASDDSFEKSSKDWSTDVDMVPRGLDDDEFEKWLFRLQ
ncbi:hypothetical protein NLU13_1313 [Sarocladium strictum]|uniref:SET domain-containing protein n=1 Tax=Sarocladium strictum TaxID=5046 RepID=A0AA39GRG9_SARSR|nr:hypothetical protein NLU13_1313 [Sarocladium strictum]